MESATVSYEINYDYPCIIQPFSFGTIELESASAHAGITEPSNTGLALSCYPNPVNELATFELTLANTAQGRLVLYDLTGKELKVIREGNISKGTHQFMFPTENMTNGIYFYHWISETGQTTGKMIICH